MNSTTKMSNLRQGNRLDALVERVPACRDNRYSFIETALNALFKRIEGVAE